MIYIWMNEKFKIVDNFKLVSVNFVKIYYFIRAILIHINEVYSVRTS